MYRLWLAYPVEIISTKINEHYVFCALLLIREQISLETLIFCCVNTP